MKSKINPLDGVRTSGLAGAALAVIISLCGSVAAQATPIIYTFSGIASGALGAHSFNNASFTITATADTSQITSLGAGIPDVPDTSAAISISGIGSGTFSISTINVDNQSIPAVGFSDPVQDLAILFVEDPAFATYDLSTPIGPISGAVGAYNSGAQFATTAGAFSFSSVSTATFQATPVPEPGTISLFALAGLAHLIWRKRICSKPQERVAL
jgi:hypothetical protein